MNCARCHRPLKRASVSGFGPVCAKRQAPAPSGERDLFIPQIETDCEAALFRLHLGIAVMAAAAHAANRAAFKRARAA